MKYLPSTILAKKKRFEELRQKYETKASLDESIDDLAGKLADHIIMADGDKRKRQIKFGRQVENA